MLTVGALVLVVLLAAGLIFYLNHQVNTAAQPANQVLSVPTLPTIPNLSPHMAPSPIAQPPAQAPAQVPAQEPAQSPAQVQPPAPAPIETRHVTAKEGQCALFTKADLTQVLGVTFTHAMEDATGCTYKGDLPREWVRVEILWTGGRNALQQRATAYETLTKSNPKGWMPPFQTVPGMGDAAFVNLVNAVQVRKGDIAFTLDLRYFHDMPDPNALVPDSARLLVNRALDRL